MSNFDIAGIRHRAFISYAREDRGLVDDLYQRLTKWRAPGPLRKRQGKHGAPPRSLNVYMDRKSQQTGETLSSGLRDKLEQSAFLIVVCSKAGADPDSWVTREIEHFLKIASPDRIIPIIVREEADQPLSEVFPAPLLAMGEDAPIGADMLHDGGIVPVTHKIIGGLTGFSQNEIAREQELADIGARRTAQRIAAGVSALAIAAIVAAIGAAQQRNQALYEQSSNLADKARGALAESRTDFAMLLALEGAPTGKGAVFERPDNPDITTILPSTIYNNRIKLVLPSADGAISHTSISADGLRVAHITTDGSVNVVDVDGGETVFTLDPISGPINAVFSPDGEYLIRAAQRRIEIFDAATGALRVAPEVNMQLPQIFFSHNGRHLFAADQQTGAFSGWSLNTGDPIITLPSGALLTTDSGLDRALIRRPDGGVMIVNLNDARIEGALSGSAGSGEVPFVNVLRIRDDAPLTDHPFGETYRMWDEYRRSTQEKKDLESQSKIVNFENQMASGGQARPVQFSAPDLQYMISGDTIIKMKSPSAANGRATAFPKFTVIDVSETARLRTFNGFPVNVSPSGDMVFYVAQSDCELKVYIRSKDDSKSVREQPDGCNNGYFISQLYLSPDENYAIAVFTDGVAIFNLHSLKNGGEFLPALIPLFHATNERVIAAGFDAQSNVAYTFTDDGGRLWEPATGDPLGHINGAMQWVDAEGHRIVTLAEDRAARVIDLDLLPVRETWPGAAFVDPSGRRALMIDSVNIDSFIPYILDIESGERIAELSGVFDRPIAQAGMSRDGAIVATLSASNDGAYDDYVELWDGTTGAHRGVRTGAPTRISFPTPVVSFMLDAQAGIIVAIGVNNVWYGYDLATGRERWRNASFVAHQVFGQTENLELVLLGSASGQNAIVWSPTENRIVLTLPPNIQTIASTGDNSLIAASSGKAIALYRRAANGQYQQAGVYSEHNAAISSLRINKAGDTVLSASTDRTAHLWDARTGRKLREFREPEFAITSAIFNEREDRVITTSLSGFVRVWDAASGLEIAALQVESSGANYSWSARLGPDEREIIVSTIRSTRRFALPPQYDSTRAMVKAACDALPPGATLAGDYVKERYKLRSAKGENGNPCAHYGLLHWKYYRAQWCSAVGYGCAGERGWVRRRLRSADGASASRAAQEKAA